MDRNFKWNGEDVIFPTKMQWGFQEISSEETKRTLDGTMKKDVIATKTKVNCGWNCLSDTEASKLLSSIKKNIFGQLTFPDAFSGTDVTKTFYTGDATADVLTMLSGKVIWNVSFNFIEK